MKHYEWIYGPNYGMIDCKLSESGGERPHVTRESPSFLSLVPLTVLDEIDEVARLVNSSADVNSLQSALLLGLMYRCHLLPWARL